MKNENIPIHSNRVYPTDEITYEAKKARQKENYRLKKEKLSAFKKADETLKIFYNIYANRLFPAELLEGASFDWDLSIGTTVIDNVTVTVVGTYGYSIFTHNKIRICKIN